MSAKMTQIVYELFLRFPWLRRLSPRLSPDVYEAFIIELIEERKDITPYLVRRAAARP
jgi:hypothetical protein